MGEKAGAKPGARLHPCCTGKILVLTGRQLGGWGQEIPKYDSKGLEVQGAMQKEDCEVTQPHNSFNCKTSKIFQVST